MSPRELFERIEIASPPFREIAKMHVADNSELLPHLLMRDLLRYVGRHFEPDSEPAPRDKSEAVAVLAQLDNSLLCGSDETVNAIAVSFLENIETEPFYSRLRPFLGLALRRELALQTRWR